MAEEIRKLAEKLPLSKKISEEALKIYKEIETEPFPKEYKAETSIYLACDKYSCALVRKLPKPKSKILRRARKKTGIMPNLEAIDRVDAICELINKGKNVSRKAKEILKKYKEKYPSDYYGKAPSITAAAAVYIASKLCGEPISQDELREYLGITTLSIRNRYRDIAEKLPSEYSWLIRFL